jgi:Dehydrogenase E1 component
MAAALLMIRICVVRVCTTVKGTGVLACGGTSLFAMQPDPVIAMAGYAIWSLPMIFICQNNRYAEHSQFARYTAGADVAARAICQRLHCALVLFKKSRRYLPRSAFGQAIDYALSNWPLLGVYL